MNTSNKHVLYVSYTGLLEPLGRSQILAYLSRLSDDYTFTILSFEKPESLDDVLSVQKLKEECASFGIEWVYKTYHSKPRLMATAWDLLVLIFSIVSLSTSRKSAVIHCRSYVPAMATWMVNRVTRTPFIFDMRALWVDEMVTASRLKESGWLFKVLKRFERKLLHDAEGSVSLTEKAVNYLVSSYAEIDPSRIHVIPTCVNLDLFFPNRQDNCYDSKTPVTIGSVGSLSSGWFPVDWLFDLYLASQAVQKTNLTVITKDRLDAIDSIVGSYGLDLSGITLRSSEPKSVVYEIHEMTYGVVFNKPSLGRLGSFPTRMAEFLACGVPVIGNAGVGDVADIIRKYRVGVVVENNSLDSLSDAVKEMAELLKDPDLEARCLYAVNDYFCADIGAQKYRKIYRKIVDE
ncbi:D-inositol-3-phosphate glycosyltransferase [BD1-7 clade bacterium]|uniref:D-inositol-3-phosphate glycosyltransferase n=1 Tax=BD1-7 clade bacterium TaxID=2029982 RepID=A0A5S9N1U8_9GAMM|nr:D-inositol-3-phosphate glycosyltransferase [BD1-7 clade bacterium]CAA0083815.1 D-inositol-3-phosphate glycosyltransferase [BD1-7 clade bacterium]